jgi:hypothetical protein
LEPLAGFGQIWYRIVLKRALWSLWLALARFGTKLYFPDSVLFGTLLRTIPTNNNHQNKNYQQQQQQQTNKQQTTTSKQQLPTTITQHYK